MLLVISMVSAKVVKIEDLFVVEEKAEIVSDEVSGTTTYFYAGSKLVASKNSEIKYHFRDRLGSDVDSKQLPFGQEIYSDSRFSFTGKELDSKLYYFGARYHDSEIGRFTSVDPVKGELAYGYVMNNPMNLIDPSGLSAAETDEKIGNALILVASPESDHNTAIYGDIDWEIEAISKYYRTYIDTVSTRDEFYSAHEEGYNALGGVFDLYYGSQHGTAYYVNLGKERLRSVDLRSRGLARYYSPTARGVQNSCSGADTTCPGNMISSLSDAMGIPFEGLLGPIGYTFTDSLQFGDPFYMEKIPGFKTSQDGDLHGSFESENKLIYSIYMEEGNYVVHGFSHNPNEVSDEEVYAIMGGEWTLPPDFNPEKIFHYGKAHFDNSQVGTVEPPVYE